MSYISRLESLLPFKRAAADLFIDYKTEERLRTARDLLSFIHKRLGWAHSSSSSSSSSSAAAAAAAQDEPSLRRESLHTTTEVRSSSAIHNSESTEVQKANPHPQ
jgi:hypothetical protein